MNFKWKKLAERGDFPIGFVDIHELVDKQKAIAIIHYLPQHSDEKQRVMLTLILEGEKRNWTDGTLSSIFEDTEYRIKNAEYFKFNNYNNLSYMDTQIFTIKSLADFNYLNHGDCAFFDS